MESKPQISQSGVEVQEFEQIFTELAEGYRKIYGQDINLQQDSPDGQRVGITAKAVYDLQNFGQYIYSNLDPDFSSGQFQNVLIKFNGINRRPATRSQKDITITTDKALTLPADFTLKDNLDQIWVLAESKALQAGENRVTFYAKKFGAIESQSTAVFTPQLIVDGVIAVSSDQNALVGQAEESDEELRIRRNKTFENAAYSTVGGLLSKLLNVPNVVDAIVYENPSNQPDSDKNMSPHSIWCIVRGGEIENITQCLVKNKTAGAATKGTIRGQYTETIQRADGSTFKIAHALYFDRPKAVNLHVRLSVQRKIHNNAVDLEQIKQALTQRKFYIHESLSATALYCDAYRVPGEFVAYDLAISKDGVHFTNQDLVAGYDEYFVINPEHVEITEIV